MMPDLDGIAFHNELQRTRPDLLERLVVMTGGACSPETRAFRDTRRPDQHVAEPFSAEALRCRVSDLLDRYTSSAPPAL
jgi:response regulator RpfG family c-di-GMP phosphodiesterase